VKQAKSLHNHWAPQYWPTWIGLGCLRLICLLPHTVALAVGRVFGRIAHRVGAERRAIVRRNIQLCFPELSTAERNTLAHDHFLALGMSAIEMGLGRWASDRAIQDLCDIENLEYLTEPMAAGKGVIILSAHFTTLEVSGLAIRLAGVAYDAVFRRNRSEFITELLRKGRERSAESTIEKRDIKKMVRSLRDGRAVWYAPDQSYNRKGSVVVDFFGVPSMHTTATSSLAQLGKAVTLPFLPRRKADGSYVMTVLPAFDNFPSDDALADTRRYVKVLEDHIRTCPEQYLWIHRKFKGLPAEYPDLYADLDASK